MTPDFLASPATNQHNDQAVARHFCDTSTSPQNVPVIASTAPRIEVDMRCPNMGIPFLSGSSDGRTSNMDELSPEDNVDTEPPHKKQRRGPAARRNVSSSRTSMSAVCSDLETSSGNPFRSMNEHSDQLVDVLNATFASAGPPRIRTGESKTTNGSSSRQTIPTAASSSRIPPPTAPAVRPLLVAGISEGLEKSSISSNNVVEPPQSQRSLQKLSTHTSITRKSGRIPAPHSLFAPDAIHTSKFDSLKRDIDAKRDSSSLSRSLRPAYIEPTIKKRKGRDLNAYEADHDELKDWKRANVAPVTMGKIAAKVHESLRPQVTRMNMRALRSELQKQQSLKGKGKEITPEYDLRTCRSIATRELPHSVRLDNLLEEIFGEEAKKHGFSKPRPQNQLMVNNSKRSSQSDLFSTLPTELATPNTEDVDPMIDPFDAGSTHFSNSDTEELLSVALGLPSPSSAEEDSNMAFDLQFSNHTDHDLSDNELRLPSSAFVEKTQDPMVEVTTQTVVPTEMPSKIMFHQREDLLLGVHLSSLSSQPKFQQLPEATFTHPTPSTQTPNAKPAQDAEREPSVGLEIISPMVLEQLSTRTPSPIIVDPIHSSSPQHPSQSDALPSSPSEVGNVQSSLRENANSLFSSTENPNIHIEEDVLPTDIPIDASPSQLSLDVEPRTQRESSSQSTKDATLLVTPPFIQTCELAELSEGFKIPTIFDAQYRNLRVRVPWSKDRLQALEREVEAQIIVAEAPPLILVWQEKEDVEHITDEEIDELDDDDGVNEVEKVDDEIDEIDDEMEDERVARPHPAADIPIESISSRPLWSSPRKSGRSHQTANLSNSASANRNNTELINPPPGLSGKAKQWSATLRSFIKGKKKMDLQNLKKILEDIYTNRIYIRATSSLAEVVNAVALLPVTDKDEIRLRTLSLKSLRAWGREI